MAYISATVTESFREGDGRLHFRVQYAGDAGEPTIVKSVYISENLTLAAMNLRVRGQAMDELDRLNSGTTIFQTVQAALPYSLDVTTPLPTAPASTFGAYFAAAVPFTPGATPQDVFTLTGSASKTITVLGAGIATIQTTAGVNAWFLAKRSTANSGGTSSAVAAVPVNDAHPAASATVLQYTVNPTAGTLVGRVWSGRVASPTAAGNTVGNSNIDLTPMLQRQQIVLSGITDVLAWNFNGAALPAGLSVSAWFAWFEN